MTTALPGQSETALLRDGAAIEVRPAASADLDALITLHDDLSERSRYFRFNTLAIDMRRTVTALLAPDAVNLVALAGSRIVGHGCLAPTGPQRAEVAFTVADDWQHQGLAAVLLERLVGEAGESGLTTLTAEVHPSNRSMIEVFSEVGLHVSVQAAADTLQVEMPAGRTPELLRRFDEEHRQAAVAGLDHVLRPRAIAVIGASDRRGSPGGELLRSLAEGGFQGALHVVHPAARTVAGVPAVPRPEDLPEGVDLAVIAVPAADVVAVARGCAAAGARALVVLSAGFTEAGPAGARRQHQLLDICQAAGMRLVGPTSLGVITTDPAVSMNATFAPQRVHAGGVAIATQSGAAGVIALDLAARRGLGLSCFVSLGDRADVSSNDLMRAWVDDPRTSVIGLYLESFGNARAFTEVAREVARIKPIVAVKAGPSAASAKRNASRVGAMLEGSEALAEALLSHAGVIRVDTLGELLDVAAVLDRSGLPEGPALGIVTNATGAGVACADAAEAAGLTLPRLRPATRLRVRELRPDAGVSNPVDLFPDVPAGALGRAVSLVAADPGIDAVVALHVPPLAGGEDDTMLEVAAAAAELPVPVIAVPLAQDVPASLPAQIAVLGGPEHAARALGRIARHCAWRAVPDDPALPPAGIDRVEAAAAVAAGLAAGGGWLAPALAARLAQAYGIPLAATATATTASEVSHLARTMTSRVAVKAIAPELTHKADYGAIELDLETPEEAGAAADRMAERLMLEGVDVTGFLVQEMIVGGIDLLVGAVNDPTFGPVIACSAGGLGAELWRDMQVRLAPIGPRAATEMLEELQCFPLLLGWRGAPAVPLPAVHDVLRRVAALAADRPEIAELECNPVVAGPDGVVAVDLRARLHAH